MINVKDGNNNEIFIPFDKPTFPRHQYNFIQKIIKSNAVGVHIRQGNKNDYDRGYFFSEEWRGINERLPKCSPQFCCFADKSKNLSACPSNISPIEKYAEAMKKFPPDTIFFVCADRPVVPFICIKFFPIAFS